MSDIAKAFDHGKAFIPFITCGDPDLETTAEIVRAMRPPAPTSSNSVSPSPIRPRRVRSYRGPTSGR